MRLLLVGILASLVLSACNGAGSSPHEPKISACQDLSIDQKSVLPGQPLRIHGLDALPDVEGVAIFEGEEQPLVESVVAGSIVAPFPPGDFTKGGVAEVVLVVSQTRCRVGRVEIEPLPDVSPEAMNDYVDTIQTYVSDAAEAAGITVDMLKQPSGLLSHAAGELLFLQFLLDHPDNPNSLRRMIEDEVIVLNGEVIAINRQVLGYILQTLDDSFDGEYGPNLSAFSGGPVMYCFPDDLSRLTARNISACMKEQAFAKERSEKSALLGDLITGLALVLALTPEPTQVLKFLAFSGYVATAANIAFWKLREQRLPSKISAFTFDVTEPVLSESVRAANWINVRITVADSNPASLDAIVSKVMTELFVNRALKVLPKPAKEKFKNLWEQVFALGVDAAKKLLQEKLQHTHTSFLELPAIRYSSIGPISLTGFSESFTSSIHPSGDGVVRIMDHGLGSYGTVEPIANGSDLLILELLHLYWPNNTLAADYEITVEGAWPAELHGAITYVWTQARETVRDSSRYCEGQEYVDRRTDNISQEITNDVSLVWHLLEVSGSTAWYGLSEMNAFSTTGVGSTTWTATVSGSGSSSNRSTFEADDASPRLKGELTIDLASKTYSFGVEVMADGTSTTTTDLIVSGYTFCGVEYPGTNQSNSNSFDNTLTRAWGSNGPQPLESPWSLVGSWTNTNTTPYDTQTEGTAWNIVGY